MTRETRRKAMLRSWDYGGKLTKILWLERWMNKGKNKLNVMWWFVGFFGLSSQDLVSTLVYGVLTLAMSFISGMQMDWYDVQHRQSGISQIYDKFINDARRSLDITEEK